MKSQISILQCRIKSQKWILFFIIIVAFILRIYQLGNVPISPDWDEASLGYNAYSILHTGRDEYGALIPVVMRSFDDYKPALYSYITIPSIALFGLTVWAVRLPSAVFGVLTVLAVYFLAKELFKKESISLLSSFLLAISPWHIQFSRLAFETNVGLAFNIFGALFFLKGLKRPWLLFVSIASFVASAYVYQSEKVFSPLIILALFLIFRKELFKLPKKYIASAVLIGFILSLPMLWYIVSNKNALERAQGVSIFADQSSLKQDATRLLTDRQNHDYVGLILDNRRFVFAKEIAANYISHFDFNWLFITGDLSRHHAPNMGLLYLWELPFILSGIYFLLFGDYDKKTKWTVFSWYLIAPVAASVTTGVPHAVRALDFLPTYQIFAAIGIIIAFRKISNIKYQISNIRIKYLIFTLYLLFLIFNISYYLDQYFVQQNYFNALDWQYGYAKMVPFVKSHQNLYKSIIVSNRPYMDQSYIFFLFYLKYDPYLYQLQSRNASGGFREDHKFSNFQFRQINWNNEKKDKNILYVGRADDFPPGVHVVYRVNFPDSKPAMLAVAG